MTKVKLYYDLKDFIFNQNFDIAQLQSKVCHILQYVDDTDDLIQYLIKETDFFEAPASTRYHSNFQGGLAYHSLCVLYNLLRLNINPSDDEDTIDIRDDLRSTTNGNESLWISLNDIIISALCHDLCKTNFYIPVQKWRKDDRGKWESYTTWGIDDKFPLGHGDKSVVLLSKHFNSNKVIDTAIRWHMGAFSTNNYQDFATACNYHPLVALLHSADFISTYVTEAETFNCRSINY